MRFLVALIVGTLHATSARSGGRSVHYRQSKVSAPVHTQQQQPSRERSTKRAARLCGPNAYVEATSLHDTFSLSDAYERAVDRQRKPTSRRAAAAEAAALAKPTTVGNSASACSESAALPPPAETPRQAIGTRPSRGAFSAELLQQLAAEQEVERKIRKRLADLRQELVSAAAVAADRNGPYSGMSP
jgi:hypothetical protein